MSRNGRIVLCAGVLLSLCLSAGTALAGANCTLSAAGVNFGTYDPLLAQPDDSTSSVTVTCNYVPPGNTTVSYTVAVSNGTNASSATTREMASGAARLGYNVFNDAGRSQVLGTGTGGTVVARGSMSVGPGNGNSQPQRDAHVLWARCRRRSIRCPVRTTTRWS